MLFFKIKSLQRKLIAKKYGFLASIYLTINPFVLVDKEILEKKQKHLVMLDIVWKNLVLFLGYFFILSLLFFLGIFIWELYDIYFNSFYKITFYEFCIYFVEKYLFF